MGTYDTYGDKGIQIKAGVCMMEHYVVGDSCDLEDGVYIGYEGVIIINEGVFVAEHTHIFTKYGDIVDCSSLMDQYNPVAQAVNEIINVSRTITIKRCSACGLDHENIEIGEYHMTLVYIEGKQITHWATCPKTGRNIDIAIDKSNKDRCTNYLSK